MKQKILPAMIAACMMTAFTVESYAASFGRSGGGRSSFGRSVSAPKSPAPKPPSVAPTPDQNRPGGIGGTSGAVGVRKSEVTQSAANKSATPTVPAQPVQSSRPSTANTPVYTQPSNVTNGSTFMSALGGSFIGSALSNWMFGNHGAGGNTTVINNSGGAATTAAPTAVTSVPGSTTTYVDSNGVVTTQPYQPKSYSLWDFIKDVFLFGVLVSLIGGLIFVFYQGFKKLKAYWNRERGIAPVQPINPTQMFWQIQQAHANGDVGKLHEVLGPDIVDELTQNLQPYTLTIYRVSHEVVLSNNREFSVHYTFYEDSNKLNQVWHYELIGGTWRLNGLENI